MKTLVVCNPSKLFNDIYLCAFPWWFNCSSLSEKLQSYFKRSLFILATCTLCTATTVLYKNCFAPFAQYPSDASQAKLSNFINEVVELFKMYLGIFYFRPQNLDLPWRWLAYLSWGSGSVKNVFASIDPDAGSSTAVWTSVITVHRSQRVNHQAKSSMVYIVVNKNGAWATFKILKKWAIQMNRSSLFAKA